MNNCPICREELTDDAKFCGFCGAKIESENGIPKVVEESKYESVSTEYNTPIEETTTYSQTTYNEPGYNQQTSGTYNQPNGYTNQRDPRIQEIDTNPQLIWAIINTLCCCLPLGVWAIILVSGVRGKQSYEAAEKDLKTAKTINIVATVGGVVVSIVYALLSFLPAVISML